MKSNIFILCLLIVASRGYSQKLLEGFVFEKNTQKPLQGVSIYLKNQNKFIITDKKGFFSIKSQKNDDTLLISQVAYKNIEVPLSSFQVPFNCYLETDEEIEAITITPRKKKYSERVKVGDLRVPQSNFLVRNTQYFFTSYSPIVTFIPNPRKQEGFIEKVFIKIYQDKIKEKTHINSSLTQKKQSFSIQAPEYLKIKILFFSAKDTIPHQNLSKEPIVVEIREFKSQWIDVSTFNVPFPENGVFAGMQVIEVNGKDGWGNVRIPMFFSKKLHYDYLFTKGKWKRNNISQGYVDNKSGWVISREEAIEMGMKFKEKRYTYGFAIEVVY